MTTTARPAPCVRPGPVLQARPITILGVGVVASLALTALVGVLGFRLADQPLGPDRGASWYVWQLPDPTVWTRLTAWAGYVAHQLAFWGLIYYGQTKVRRYANGLHPINVIALGMNLAFLGLHELQSQLWYDGLAQDVSIFSSQGSVVLLLVVVLLMESRRRGLFFGRGTSIKAEVVDFARRYHGYLFSWAAVYTFWYHPMLNTPGHLIGFFYMFLLLLQGSLFLTGAHTHRWWTLTLEVFVAVHGTLVAVMTSGPSGMWPMFPVRLPGRLRDHAAARGRAEPPDPRGGRAGVRGRSAGRVRVARPRPAGRGSAHPGDRVRPGRGARPPTVGRARGRVGLPPRAIHDAAGLIRTRPLRPLVNTSDAVRWTPAASTPGPSTSEQLVIRRWKPRGPRRSDPHSEAYAGLVPLIQALGPAYVGLDRHQVAAFLGVQRGGPRGRSDPRGHRDDAPAVADQGRRRLQLRALRLGDRDEVEGRRSAPVHDRAAELELHGARIGRGRRRSAADDTAG